MGFFSNQLRKVRIEANEAASEAVGWAFSKGIQKTAELIAGKKNSGQEVNHSISIAQENLSDSDKVFSAAQQINNYLSGMLDSYIKNSKLELDESELESFELISKYIELVNQQSNTLNSIIFNTELVNSEESIIAYTKLYECSLEDGIIDNDERIFLDKIAEKLGITEDEKLLIENKEL